MIVGLAGSAYVPFPVSVHRDEGFLKLVELLHSTDASLASMKGVIGDWEDWPALFPGMEGGSVPYFVSPPSIIEELRFMGIKGLCAADNHASDLGEAGILTTIRHLRRGGMPFAGIGASLTEASMPCYIETAHGRIGLIGVAEYGPNRDMGLPPAAPAGYMPSDELPPFKSRPGLNLVRFDAAFQVDQASFDGLRRISEEFGWQRGKADRREGAGSGYSIARPEDPAWERDSDTTCFFMGRKFVLGDTFGVSPFGYQEDMDRVYRYVREAKRQADVVVVIFKDVSHAPGIHDYARAFGHGVIDAGGDIFDFHRAGGFKGLEVYKGRPMFYGGSSLYSESLRMTQAPRSLLLRAGLDPESTPADLLEARRTSSARSRAEGGTRQEYGPSFINTVAFDQHGEPTEVRMYPMDPNREEPKGYPRLIDVGSELFDDVLRRASDRSKPYGVTVKVRDGAGVVQLK